MSSTTTTVSMNARRRSGKRGPTSASRPSANAVSVDIATPQPCAEGRPALKTRIDRDRDRHPAEPGQQRQRESPPLPQLAEVELAPRLEPDDEEEERHQPAVHPVAEVERDTVAAEVDREPRRPDRVVRRRVDVHPERARRRAAASRTAAPPVSVRRNSRSGVWMLRAHAVRPVKRRVVSPPLLFELTGPSNPSGAHIGLDRTVLGYKAIVLAGKKPRLSGVFFMGGTGLEPVTPSLSSWCSPN